MLDDREAQSLAAAMSVTAPTHRIRLLEDPPQVLWRNPDSRIPYGNTDLPGRLCFTLRDARPLSAPAGELTVPRSSSSLDSRASLDAQTSLVFYPRSEQQTTAPR